MRDMHALEYLRDILCSSPVANAQYVLMTRTKLRALPLQHSSAVRRVGAFNCGGQD